MGSVAKKYMHADVYEKEALVKYRNKKLVGSVLVLHKAFNYTIKVRNMSLQPCYAIHVAMP